KISAQPSVDMKDFQTWKTEVVTGLNGGVRQLLKTAGVEVRQGFFRFTRKDQGVLEFGEAPPTHIQFNNAIIATGSRPTMIAELPHDGIRILDSSDVLSLDVLPKTIAIVGAGYIGVELGTALAQLGSTVFMIEAGERILPALPATLVAPVVRRLAEIGVEVRTKTTVVSDDGKALTVITEGATSQIAVDYVVVAIGRTPNTDDLGLEVIGVKPNARGILEVGADLLVTPKIAAIGDITPGPALAHKASAEAHVAAEVLSGHAARFDPTAIPAVIFSDPEIAMTGLTLEEASAAGYSAQVAMFPMAASGRAFTLGDKAGFAQLVHTTAGVVLGAQIVGPRASEYIAEVTLAIEMGASLQDLADTIHPHPSMSETLPEAARVGLGFPIHVSPKRQRNNSEGK
ncbi:MAG: NAD(P)/FAD-dependent oxidoreductase, partial [Actinobacteria bacterium]|nr:NAD(P)/FAD-dependent oxidoreductase [Actinomycetota bacterium]